MWDISETKAVVFDYGNTLIEFGPRQVEKHYAVLHNALAGMIGECDPVRLKAVMDRQTVEPFSRGYKERTLRELCAELVRELYGREPGNDTVKGLVEARQKSFVESIELPDGVTESLTSLRRYFRLGFLSNYPCGRSILDSLDKIGLVPLFETAVVSGDVGYLKPHPRPFEIVLEDMGLPAGACVYVGDNWLADIQGAKGVGMKAILTTQYKPYGSVMPRPDDHEPDAVIRHLRDLESLLLSGRR